MVTAYLVKRMHGLPISCSREKSSSESHSRRCSLVANTYLAMGKKKVMDLEMFGVNAPAVTSPSRRSGNIIL